MISKKSWIIIFITILLLLTGCGQISIEEVLLNGTINISYSTKETLNEDIKEVLLSFFKTYYESLATLEEKDLTFLFNINNPESFENANINQGILHYIINHRKLQPNDLKIKSYAIEIDIDSLNKPKKDIIEISLREHRKINFNFIENINAYTSSIQQDFILHDTEDGWKIQDYNRSEDINYLIDDLYEKAKEEKESSPEFSKELLKEIINELLKQLGLNVEEIYKNREQYLYLYNEEQENSYHKKWDNDYNRADAVAYANQWVSPNSIKRNPNWFIYDDLGGNCANYTSQCLFAGGIPMDYYGRPEAQWKWYGNYVNERNVPLGRAPAWTGVNEFYRYSLTNSRFGLVSILDNNYYNGEIGDIILFGNDLRWKHAVIITDIIKDEHGRVIDYLINSNTTDRINYPVSAYSYSNIQLIKILGWNN